MDSRLLMRWESIAILLPFHDRRRKSDTQKTDLRRIIITE